MIRALLGRRRRERRQAAATEPTPAQQPAPMAAVADRFAMQVLVLAEQQRQALDHLERDERDADTLKQLYEVDHAVALMRRAARELRVLAGHDETELGGAPVALMDVIRMATSSIESYTRVRIGSVAELAVLAYTADDMASLLSPLLDNATRYSPSTVDVSAHPTESGGVVVRVVDAGIGLKAEQVEALNATMARDVAPLDEQAGTHTGFAVVHRLARRHGVRVSFTARHSAGPGGSGGTTVVVALPAQLVCDLPQQPEVGEFPAPAGTDTPARRSDKTGTVPRHLRLAPGELDSAPEAPPEPPPPQRPAAGELPRREPKSLRRRPAAGAGSGGSTPRPKRPLAREDGSGGGSFADDLDSFAAGGRAESAADPAAQPPDHRPES
ncbi:sensor histidine kinase [Salinactinospora qingdaonensis]|uniref:histidine kinase n=1 Tax=Salinactinospora qingdaonensis TaxID=702744 RepID=A0ABP7G3C6_9ACTN